mgnify:FL=1|tara:strand:+ start:846 stop:1727 length:882 start_codon:yes stop_codon:yes gene_type:complete
MTMSSQDTAKLSPDTIANNKAMYEDFMTNVELSTVTKKDYAAKLGKLMKEVRFDDTEENIINFLQMIANPNTKTNKCFVVIRLRRYFKLPTSYMETMREEIKKEIAIHRKSKARENMDKLMTYAELLDELDKLSGRDYIMNYFWVRHGLRNQDINLRLVSKKPATITENTLIFNPKLKKPKMIMHVVDYKTAATYGPKMIEITDARLASELKALDINNRHIFETRDGKKATMNYMNVLANKNSIKKYGEGRIAKILLKHLIDSQQYDKIDELSRVRGTALATIYTSYNIMDNK